ncbi:MAG TPA: HRDC domain-containing protein, partial [Ornithinibacter sp.]|nr:HRDC domain-containing protein [Ornithinibacter sp.]
ADVPAFVVFTDATLTAIAEKVPADVGALARINGVGPAKLERYGSDVLDLLKNFPTPKTVEPQANSLNQQRVGQNEPNNPLPGPRGLP